MANDPILDAIRAGGTGVAVDDPILSAIQGTPSASLPKKSREPSPKVSADETDPIMVAISAQGSDLHAPSLEETTAGLTPLSERAARMGRAMIPLKPPQNFFVDTTGIRRSPFTNELELQPPIRTEEEKQREGTIGPQPDVDLPGPHGVTIHLKQADIDAMGKVFLPGRNPNATLQGDEPWMDMSRGLIAPQELLGEEGQKQHPILTGLGQLGEGLTTPANLALLAGTAGIGELPATMKAGLSAFFTAQMAKGATDYGVQGWKAYKRGDNAEAQRLWTLAAGSAVIGGATGAHAIRESGLGPEVGPDPVVPKGTISEPLARDEAAARMQTVGAGEKLAPETLATLKAQTDALAAGTNPVVYFPKGQGSIPEPPENAQVTTVPGAKQGAGTYYHDDSVTPEQIKAAVEDGSYHKILGYTQAKEEAIKGKPSGVVARDANGTELKAGLVDSSNPQAVAEQAATFARQFPESKIGVESPENVITNRQAPTAKPEISAPETPLSEQTEGTERRSPTSSGKPPEGVAERRTVPFDGIQGPPPEQLRLLSEAKKQLAGAQTVEEATQALNRIKNLQGTEAGMDIAANGGEAMSKSIREARAKESGQPMSKEAALANEAARKAKNQPDAILDAINGTAPRQSGVPRTAPGQRLEKFSGDTYGRKIAQLYTNRLRNPVEREYAMSYLKARLEGKAAPSRTESIDAARAGVLSRRIETELQRTAPKALTEKYTPEVIEEARNELQAAYNLASNFERPGRYHPDLGEGVGAKEQDAAWYGVTSSRHIVADEFPWYGKIEQGTDRLGEMIQKGKGAEYDRLLGTIAEHIEREKASAAPVMTEFSPRLRELSEKIDGNDQDLSDSLAQLANSDGRGFKNLRQYVEGKITDAEEAHKFYKLIDTASAEARQAGAAESPESHSELRTTESRRATAGTETPIAGGAEGAERPSLLETSEAAPSAKGTEDLEQGALPGFEPAIAEQKRGAARVQGERLSEEANRPLGSIESTAGRMERESPLFRDTEANLQSDLFKSKRLEPTTAVGERIQPTTGPLKGKTIEVTKIGETGVYARAEEGGPIKFVKNGEFEAVRYSGLHPKALIEGARVLQRAWEDNIAQPFIDRVLKIGDKYQKAREADPAVGEGLHLLDNAPTYLRAKAAAVVKDVIGNLSRAQERLFTLVADADSRENLRMNHPQEFVQAQNDPAIQEALRKYRPLERELTTLRERMGGQTLEQDYLRRVYDRYVAGVNKAEAPGTPERGTSAFDRVIRPQRTDKLSREATSEYHYTNGLHEFGPAFATKFIGTHLKALRDQVAREFLSKATMLPTGAPEPRSIEYNGERYYRPDVAKDLRDASAKGVKTYDKYDPTAGEKFPVPVDGKYLGPHDLVKTLTDFGRREESEPGALRRFYQEQILGAGFGVPHIANIMRRVSQTVPGGAVNPEGWARAWKVVLSKELRDRGISGLDDPMFDMLAKHGAISTGEVSNLKAYIGGNINPANWARALAQVGHKFLFEPTAAKGFGGLDQRARLYVADLIKSQRPNLKDSEIAAAVRTQLGDYNRANWTDQQKMLSKFMMFPGWDFSSIRWVLQHPVKTTVPPALMVLLANRTLNYFGQNREEDRSDISNIHIGDRSYGTSLLRESVARNLFRPVLNFAQSKMRGESNQRAFDAASRGITAGAGGLLTMLRPDLSGFLALATNRQALFSGKEIVSPKDWDSPGKILPSKALEKQAVFTVRHALPALDRMLDSGEDVDMKSFAGGNLGVPNYRDDAEKRLIRNAAEANRVYSNISKLAKTDPEKAREMLKDPDNAAYALFHHDLQGMTAALNKIGQVRAAVDASKIPDAEKQSRLKALDNARQMFLGHADGLNNLLFKQRMAGKGTASTGTGVPRSLIPLTPLPQRPGSIPFRPLAQVGAPQ